MRSSTAAAKGRTREAGRAAAEHFRSAARVLAVPVHGTPRLSVEGELVLFTPEHDPPFQLERCCTQCGSSDPARWPATRVLSVAGGPVRVPDGHRCFWCRCYELSSGRPEFPAAVARPARVAAPAPAAAVRGRAPADQKPWWRRLDGVPEWAEIGPLRS